MSTPVNWYDYKHNIIIVTINKDSTWSEYYQVIEWIVAEISKVENRVDIVFHDNVGMPKGNPMPHLKWGSQKIVNLPNAGHTIIAGTQGTSNSFTKLVMTTLAKLFMKSSLPNDSDKQLLFMSNLEDALAFLNKNPVESIELNKR